VSIRVTSNGPGTKLGAALIPVPAKDAKAYQGRGIISGNPGTFHVPAPAPLPGYDASGVAKAIAGVGAGGMGQPSSQYSFWRPSLYFTRSIGPWGPVSTVSDNQMPVPAIDPRGRPAMWTLGQSPLPVQRPAPRLGQRQIRQPKVLPKWWSVGRSG